MKLIRTIEFSGNKLIKPRYAIYECPDCSQHFERRINDVIRHNQKRCRVCSNIFNKQSISHNMSSSKEYRAWASMISRCTNIKNSMYYRYGGRGIKVCESWLESFESFYNDMGDIPEKGMQIDREDNDGDYEPTNCRWITRILNVRNSSNTILTEEDVSIIKTLLLYKKLSLVSVSKIFNVLPETIGSIKKERSWKDISPMPI